MTWKQTRGHDAADADVLLDVSGAVSTHFHRRARDDGQSLARCEEPKGLQEDAEAAPPPPSMHKKSGAAQSLGGLGVLLLAVVIPVVRGGTLLVTEEPRAANTDAADWIKLLPQDVATHMDTQVDPCDDLYAFSCGSWLRQTEIPADTSSVSLFFSTVQDENEKVLREVMEQGRPLVGELYDSCMNFSNTSSATADAASVAFLSPVIQQIAAATSKSEVFQLAGNLSRAGTSFLTQLGVAADAKNATMYALYASQTGLSLPNPQYYTNRTQFDSISDAFHAYVVELFSLVGWEAHEAASQASSVIAFEQALAPLFVPIEQLQDLAASYNRMSVAQAAEKYPLLFAQYMDGTGILENLVSRNASVIVQTPSFFERVEEIVNGGSVTLDTLKAVLTYRYISTHASFLSEPFVQASFVFFEQALRGQKGRAPRWKVCLQRVIDNFPDLAGKYFALLRYDNASERLANQLVTQIQASLQKSLLHVDWLDASARQGALEKLRNMATLIGYSNASDFFPYELDGKAPLAVNLRMIKEHDFGRDVGRIGGRVDRNEWVVSGVEVNTYYQLVSNQVIVPAGILQPPFFARDQNDARNFGAIGSVTGHAITHGFDSLGRYFDGDGNLQDWWSNDTATKFLQRTECLVKQYNEFAVTSGADQNKVLGYVNGNSTLSENIADHGGLEFSFRAYQTYVADQAKELSQVSNTGETIPVSGSQTEPDLPATVADKLFFISFAQQYCSKWSDARMSEMLATGTHSPAQWRINGVARNSHDFARVFSCPAGSRMNPTTKCQLW